MNLQPIGVVKNNTKETQKDNSKSSVAQIVIAKEYEQALEQIEGFSHIIVLYWMNRLAPTSRSTLKVHPRGRKDLPLVGVFATRSPARPNPIGLTTVKVLERRGNILKVKGLDALDKTPVLDIKPYIPSHDSSTRVKTPEWVKKLQDHP